VIEDGIDHKIGGLSDGILSTSGRFQEDSISDSTLAFFEEDPGVDSLAQKGVGDRLVRLVVIDGSGQLLLII
jgi:hypothetical protein